MPEVYTNENKIYYLKQTSIGEKSSCSLLKDKEVIEIRKRYVKESAKEIYQDFKDRISFQAFQ